MRGALAEARGQARSLCAALAWVPLLGCGGALATDDSAEEFYHYRSEKVALLRIQDDAGSGSVYLEPRSQTRVTIKNRVIVKLKARAELSPILRRANVALLERLPLENAYVVEGGGHALETANLLHSQVGVEWAEPEFVGEVEPAFLPNDPHFEDAWFLQNTGQFGGKVRADLNVVPAWDVTRGKPEIKLAIFDEGVSEGHPDLNVSSLSKNFVNDPPTDDAWPATTESTHGTACAGLAAAIGNNNLGVVGVAPNATILAMKVLDWPSREFASSLSVAKATLYAAENADIGSISVGVFTSNVVADAIRQAAKTGRNGKGFLIFKSSGNDNFDEVQAPGQLGEVSSIGASSDQGLRASYSNWGRSGTKTVDFLAPAEGSGGVWTTDLLGPLGSSPDDYTGRFGGTSAATPLAAGVAALVLSANPALTREEVLDIMRSTSDKIGGVNYVGGVHPEYGHGQLNAAAAVEKALELSMPGGAGSAGSGGSGGSPGGEGGHGGSGGAAFGNAGTGGLAAGGYLATAGASLAGSAGSATADDAAAGARDVPGSNTDSACSCRFPGSGGQPRSGAALLLALVSLCGALLVRRRRVFRSRWEAGGPPAAA